MHTKSYKVVVQDWLMNTAVHIDMFWVAQRQHLQEPGGGAVNPQGLVCPSLCPFRLATHLPREDRWRSLPLLKKHLFLLSSSEKVTGQVEISQRSWVWPMGHGLYHAEFVKLARTQLAWHIRVLTGI